MAWSVVIPSKTHHNLVECVRAVLRNEPSARIIVIDDGIGPHLFGDALEIIPGAKPFVFARNVNIGIAAAGADDVIVLNDDALLHTPGGFSAMAAESAARPEYGLIASSVNNVGQTNQWPRGGQVMRDEPRQVCFICVYIPRVTIRTVGLLDERFVGYGYDDDDYCRRVLGAGLKLGIMDRCFCKHDELPSTFRVQERQFHDARFAQNREIFRQKWDRAL